MIREGKKTGKALRVEDAWTANGRGKEAAMKGQVSKEVCKETRLSHV